MLELARAKVPDGHDIDGHSLVPLLSGKAGAHDAERPQWALSQGHMADNAISWFLLREGDMKLIVCKNTLAHFRFFWACCLHSMRTLY